jgi:hypothetical protein
VLPARPSSRSFRPADLRPLDSTPGSHPTPENLLPRTSGGWDSHPRLVGLTLGTLWTPHPPRETASLTSAAPEGSDLGQLQTASLHH